MPLKNISICIHKCIYIYTCVHAHRGHIHIFEYIYRERERREVKRRERTKKDKNPHNTFENICVYKYKCIWVYTQVYMCRSNVKLGGFQSQLEAPYVSSHTKKKVVIQRNSLSVDDNIYAPTPGRLSTLTKELTATTRIMQSSSYELSTLVSGKAKCKQMKATT